MTGTNLIVYRILFNWLHINYLEKKNGKLKWTDANFTWSRGNTVRANVLVNVTVRARQWRLQISFGNVSNTNGNCSWSKQSPTSVTLWTHTCMLLHTFWRVSSCVTLKLFPGTIYTGNDDPTNKRLRLESLMLAIRIWVGLFSLVWCYGRGSWKAGGDQHPRKCDFWTLDSNPDLPNRSLQP